MKRVFFSLALAFVLSLSAAAVFTWPTEPVTVRIGNQVVQATWKNGRPFVQRDQVAHLLRIPKEGEPELDLAEACQAQKAEIKQKADGSIDVRVPYQLAAGAVNVDPGQAERFKAEFEQKKYAEATAPKLVVLSNKPFIADTTYIRAMVTIGNNGGGPSEACWAEAHFVDWYGRPFAKPHRLLLRALQPGESEQFEFFSSVQKDEQNELKADKYRCDVKFVPLK